MSAVDLRVDWCSYEAAKYAVEKWHYSRSMPSGKLVVVGAWEGSRFVGSVIFGRGSNKHLGMPFGLEQTGVAELVRVALGEHDTPTTKIVACAVSLLSHHNSGLRLLVSFADPNEGHVGTIYQAMNWLYVGRGSDDKRCTRYAKHGRVYHWRTVAGELNKRGLRSTVDDAHILGFHAIPTEPKHRYLYPLDRAMRRQIAPLAKPYPKRTCGPSVEGDTSGDQPEGAGSIPAARSIVTV